MRKFALLFFFLSCASAKAAAPDCTDERPLNRACVTDSDCTLVGQQTSCCGDRSTRGINRADVARFEAEEKICSADGAPCKCLPGPEQLDVDTQKFRERKPRKAAVACREKLCTSFVAP